MSAAAVYDYLAAYGTFRVEAYRDGYASRASVSIAKVKDGSDGQNGLQGPQGVPGTNGTGIPGPPGTNGQTPYVHFAYADSADGAVNFTTAAAGGRYFIGVYVDYVEADSGNPAAYMWSLQRGADGANGIPGPPGANGQTTYVHVAYASSPDGSVNFSVDDPTGRTYIGVRTDYVLADSGFYGDYTWSLIKGADGAPGSPGSPGSPGAPGAPGVSSVAVSAQPEAVQISVDASGAAVPGALPVAIGNTAIQAGSNVVITGVAIVSASGVSASVNGTSVQITALSGNEGEVVYTVTAAGQTVRKRIAISTARAGADGAVQQVLSVTTPQLTWASYQQHGGTLAINASGTGKLDVNLTGSMRAPLGGELRFYSKLQYRITGGTWTDVPNSERLSTVSEQVFEPTRQLPASVNSAGPYPLTGLTPAGAYEVRALTTKVNAANDNSQTVNLSLSAKQVV